MSLWFLTPCLTHYLFTGFVSVFWQCFLVRSLVKTSSTRPARATSVLSATCPLPALLSIWPIRFPSTTGSSESLGCGACTKSTFPRNTRPLPILIILQYPLGSTLNPLHLNRVNPLQRGMFQTTVAIEAVWVEIVSEMRTRDRKTAVIGTCVRGPKCQPNTCLVVYFLNYAHSEVLIAIETKPMSSVSQQIWIELKSPSFVTLYGTYDTSLLWWV